MNTSPDQWQLEDRIELGWEYIGYGWFVADMLIGRFISDSFFLSERVSIH